MSVHRRVLATVCAGFCAAPVGPRGQQRFVMISVVIAGSLLSQPSLSRTMLETCLGTPRVALNAASVAQQRAAAGEEAWTQSCRDARTANQRRLQVTRSVLSGKDNSAAFSAASRFVQDSRAAKLPVQAELYEHAARDQAARSALSKDAKALYAPALSGLAETLLNGLISADAMEADRRNQQWLARVLRERGWFTISRDGTRADLAAWLIAQHSDADRDFQRRLIAVLEPLVVSGETSANRFAFLYDRWATATGAPQRYAISGECLAPGHWQPFTTESPTDVDDRRHTAGLPSLAEWTAKQSANCH